MLVRTLSYVYPGVNKSGVAVVKIRNESVERVAVGSVDNTALKGLLEETLPTEMIVAVNKFFRNEHVRVPIPESVSKFTIARPGWERLKIPLVLDGEKTHGVYMHNVYKLMFHNLVRRGVTLRNWDLERFNREWVRNESER